MNSQHINFLWIYLAAAIAASIVGTTARRWSLNRRLTGNTDSADSNGNSAILSYYTAGHDLAKIGDGTVQNMRYNVFMTSPATAQHGMAFTSEEAIIYVLELPFNTQTHLVGLSKDYKLDRLQFESFLESMGMQKNTLEGDFPDYFDIYATDQQSFNVEYVLNPKAMEFVVEYARSHFWEIHDAELYFVVTDSTTAASDLITESQKFVDSIRPALAAGEPGAPVVHHETPYGEYDGPPLACPICKSSMELHANRWFTCTAGHGALLPGKDLEQLNAHLLQIAADSNKAVEHGILICPHCQAQMEEVPYDGSKLMISSCPKCIYRWLDATKIAAINTSKL